MVSITERSQFVSFSCLDVLCQRRTHRLRVLRLQLWRFFIVLSIGQLREGALGGSGLLEIRKLPDAYTGQRRVRLLFISRTNRRHGRCPKDDAWSEYKRTPLALLGLGSSFSNSASGQA